MFKKDYSCPKFTLSSKNKPLQKNSEFSALLQKSTPSHLFEKFAFLKSDKQRNVRLFLAPFQQV